MNWHVANVTEFEVCMINTDGPEVNDSTDPELVTKMYPTTKLNIKSKVTLIVLFVYVFLLKRM